MYQTKERQQQYDKQYYEKNKERKRNYRKKYVLENREKVKEQQRKHYLKNRDKILSKIDYKERQEKKKLWLTGGNYYKVLKRDRYMCQVCGATNKTLHIHHIDGAGYTSWNKLKKQDRNNDIRNLITLCNSCHGSIERLSRFLFRNGNFILKYNLVYALKGKYQEFKGMEYND